MSAVAAAVVGVGAYSAYNSKKAAKSAAGAQEDAAAANIGLQRDMWQKSLALNKPFYQSGKRALGRLNNFSMPDMGVENFEASPDYQFRLQQGQNALLSGASAGGMRLSGRTLQALQDYGQNTAAQEYGNWYGRRYGSAMDDWNRQAQLAGIGQTANSQAINANQAAAAGISQQNQNIANAQSAQAMQQANSVNNLFNQGMQAYGIYKGWNG